MVIMLGIALVSVIAMYLLYPYCNRYVRVENTGASKKGKKYHYKKNPSSSLSGTGMSKQQEKKIGFSIFIAIFVVALLARLIGAIALGGYGAIFWLWLAALLGMVIKYAEVTLSIRYREKDAKGDWVGGPM